MKTPEATKVAANAIQDAGIALHATECERFAHAALTAAAPIFHAQAKVEARSRVIKVFTALSAAVAEGHAYTITQIQDYVLDAMTDEGKNHE